MRHQNHYVVKTESVKSDEIWKWLFMYVQFANADFMKNTLFENNKTWNIYSCVFFWNIKLRETWWWTIFSQFMLLFLCTVNVWQSGQVWLDLQLTAQVAKSKFLIPYGGFPNTSVSGTDQTGQLKTAPLTACLCFLLLPWQREFYLLPISTCQSSVGHFPNIFDACVQLDRITKTTQNSVQSFSTDLTYYKSMVQ